ncbi:hypothetical protein HDU97_007493 [Phlyctochytrium planicorne]|nr:hypothetical protein HDU97_007493 [Phlyctochytrium planicorne]
MEDTQYAGKPWNTDADMVMDGSDRLAPNDHNSTTHHLNAGASLSKQQTPSVSGNSTSYHPLPNFPGSFDRPNLVPMGPLTEFPDIDTVMAQVRTFLEKSGAGKQGVLDAAVEEEEEIKPNSADDGMDVDMMLDDPLPSAFQYQPGPPSLSAPPNSTPTPSVFHPSPDPFSQPLPPLPPPHEPIRYPGTDLPDADADDSLEDAPTDPTHFLYSVLVHCMQGLRGAQDLKSTDLSRAISACRMGLDYINIIDNGVAQNEVQHRYVSEPGTSGKTKAKGRKVGRPKNKSNGGNRSLSLPAEILLRVFSFLSEPDMPSTSSSAPSNLSPGVPASALYACSLVSRQWDAQASTELWKRVTMDDDAPRLSRFVMSLSATTLSGRHRGHLVRVMSIACTDAEMSLLALAANRLPNLHSLELRRSFIPNAASYRLMNRLRGRFPSLRSLVADMIPPAALADLISIVRGSHLLSNLHVSVGAPDYGGMLSREGLAGAPEPIQSLLWKIPNLRSISFWRVTLPRDEGLWVPALASSCPGLKAIRIDDCGDISMDILVGIWRRCDIIECISMRKVKRRTAFTELVRRPSMNRVVLDGCWMNDGLCANIGRCAPNLEIFYVEDDWADDDFKHPLAPTVVNELTDAGVLELAKYQHNLRAITFIGFPGRRNFRASSLRALLDSNPSCFALNLARMDPQWPYRMSDSWLLELSSSLRNIEVLELYIQNGVTEEGFLESLRRAAAAGAKPRGLGVDVNGSDSSMVDSEQQGGIGAGRIRRLGLSGWSQLSDRTLYCLPMLCPRLERLDMAGANVTAVGLQSLVDAAERFRECVVTVPPVEGEEEGVGGVGVGGVRWGNVMQYDDPVSEDVFSPYSVWEREVRRLGKKDGIIY